MRATKAPMSGIVVAVAGACGGAGTSTVAAAVARRLRSVTARGMLLDLVSPGGGIEVTLGIEAQPGARWPELADARGDVDGRAVIDALPTWGQLPVLSVSRLALDPPSDDVIVDVASALLRSGESLVLDLPTPGAWTPAIRAMLADADHILLVAPLTLSGAAGLVALEGQVRKIRRSGEPSRVSLITNGSAPGAVDAADLAELTGLPAIAQLRHDRTLAGRLERGEGPAVGRGSRLAKLATDILTAVGIEAARG